MAEDDVNETVDDATDATPDADTINVEIKRLAGLSKAAYELERKTAAKRLGMRAPILDQLVTAARDDGDGDDGKQGRALTLPEPEPWPEPVDGDALLDEIVFNIKKYVALPTEAADAVALWMLHAHALDAATISARLFLTSPTPRCGKTTLLNVIEKIVTRPLPVANITPAAVFRTIETAAPTLLIDEADSFAKNNEDLRGIINSGHRRGGGVIRTVGDDHEPRQFSTWAATAIAGIGNMPETIRDRSIIVALRRKRPDEKVVRFRIDRTPGLDRLASMAARWTADHIDALSDLDPELPQALHDRAADNWRALVAVADRAGGEWPDRARHAATALSGGDDTDGESAGVQVVGDIRDIFTRRGADQITTAVLLEELHRMDERPWPEWGRARKPISARQLGTLLRPFGVSPGTIRENETTAKGYRLEAFKDVFARYPASLSVTTSQPPENCEKLANSICHTESFVTDRKPPNLASTLTCDGVTDGNGGTGAYTSFDHENDEYEQAERAALQDGL